MRAWVFGLEGLNGVLLVLLFVVLAQPVHAQEAPAAVATVSQTRFLGAAIATGLAAIGAGLAVGIAGAAAIGAIAEKPDLLGRTLIFVGLAEGIVIYGLIISFLILRS
ncbi:MAG TPA: ATP synthase subunit C [Bryobacteraceae bacterium]|nr:ATP synthase subunit C [Bryobacteraceae bacterium]